jgi:hypothetical protein
VAIDPSQLPAGLRAFVEDDVALLPAGLGEMDRVRLIELLQERGDAARLDRLGTSPDKALAKAARRALHVLATRGKKATSAPRTFQVAGPYAAPAPPSYASIVDGRGERAVWYVEADEGGFAVYQIELSETVGILDMTAMEVPRRAWRDQVAQMRRNERVLVGEIDGRHARVLIERAYRQMTGDGRSPPEAFARAHLRVQASDEDLAAPHPLHALVGDEPTPTDAALAALLEWREFAMFVPSREGIAALDIAVGEVVESKVVLEPTQRLARLEDAVVRIAEQQLDGRARAKVAERLLELGLVLLSRQPDAEGRAAARACVAAADSARADSPVREHPTLLGMFRRLVPAELLLKIRGG